VNSNRRVGLLFAGAAMFGGASLNALAAGYQIYEQSGSGLGDAYAGAAASAEDASTLFYNPAGLSWLHGSQTVGALQAMRPTADFTNAGSTTPLGAPARGGNGGDAGSVSIFPNRYFATDRFGHGLSTGFGINAPFGLSTQYGPDWVGRYQAIDSGLQVINLHGALSYRVNDMLAVAGGLNFVRANAELSNAVDFGTICVARLGAACGAALVPGNRGRIASDGIGVVEGDDWGVGYTLGAIFEPMPGTRLGASFRSKVDLDLAGSARFNNPALGPFAALTGPFTATSVSAGLTLPEVAAFSVFSRLNPRWAVMADVTWTNWSRFEELRVEYDNLLPDTVVQQNWDDAFRYCVGVTYTMNDAWKFRTGFAYDESPVPDAFRTPRIPDEDRTWLSFGVAHRISPVGTIDVGYLHVFVD
jgi:long-chain fatty acid transport protein